MLTTEMQACAGHRDKVRHPLKPQNCSEGKKMKRAESQTVQENVLVRCSCVNNFKYNPYYRVLYSILRQTCPRCCLFSLFTHLKPTALWPWLWFISISELCHTLKVWLKNSFCFRGCGWKKTPKFKLYQS